ncbi:hypothetical protein GCM10007874_29120 [Labrys miyagiensis]|uniref:DUF304 domain-containing protein n=1 Tax=Labrys miyagiensis TaxID=346912 RepID=A0ABQ6CIC2_9HYPH|nr:hypothetical protein [Labrys miyagiensis]GLS19895.1 hypothetical protein GCM10007874_29120 [Labrys miyagiensis]
MSLQYEEIKAPRFRTETVDGYDQIIVPPQRNAFVMLFLLVWLCGWTIGGATAMHNLLSRPFQPFLAFWLCGWLLGEGFVLVSLGWMSTGAEILRSVGSDLEVSYCMLGFTRSKLYRGTAISDLSASASPVFSLNGRYGQMSLPFLGGNKTGSVKFTYGARAIYLAVGLDEAEGQLIVERLSKKLPATVRTASSAEVARGSGF